MNISDYPLCECTNLQVIQIRVLFLHSYHLNLKLISDGHFEQAHSGVLSA